MSEKKYHTGKVELNYGEFMCGARLAIICFYNKANLMAMHQHNDLR